MFFRKTKCSHQYVFCSSNNFFFNHESKTFLARRGGGAKNKNKNAS